MRLWTLHPQYLDAPGLVAVWRESLLAQKVLQGDTTGYKHHPQLARFQGSPDPLATIAAFLAAIVEEAVSRGNRFPRGETTQDTTTGALLLCTPSSPRPATGFDLEFDKSSPVAAACSHAHRPVVVQEQQTASRPLMRHEQPLQCGDDDVSLFRGRVALPHVQPENHFLTCRVSVCGVGLLPLDVINLFLVLSHRAAFE